MHGDVVLTVLDHCTRGMLLATHHAAGGILVLVVGVGVVVG